MTWHLDFLDHQFAMAAQDTHLLQSVHAWLAKEEYHAYFDATKENLGQNLEVRDKLKNNVIFQTFICQM